MSKNLKNEIILIQNATVAKYATIQLVASRNVKREEAQRLKQQNENSYD